MRMPKVPPDHTERVEFVLGKAERQIVNDAAFAYQFSRIMNPVVGLLSSPVAMISVIALILTFFSKYLPDGLLDAVKDMTIGQIADYLEAENIFLGGLFGFFGLFLGGFPGAILGVVIGSAAAEELEDVAAEIDWESTENRRRAGAVIVKTLVELRIFSEKLKESI